MKESSALVATIGSDNFVEERIYRLKDKLRVDSGT